MTKCTLCATQQADAYGSIYNIGMVCHRCSLIALAGPEMAMMPHCPTAPPDTDPEVLAAYQKGMENLTIPEFDRWLETSRHDTNLSSLKLKDRAQHEMVSKKIDAWFSKQDGERVDYVTPSVGPGQQSISSEIFVGMVSSIPNPPQKLPRDYQRDFLLKKNEISYIKRLIFDLEYDEESACGDCCLVAASLRCSRCQSQKYCSRVCQKKHWKEHKQNCVLLEVVD